MIGNILNTIYCGINDLNSVGYKNFYYNLAKCSVEILWIWIWRKCFLDNTSEVITKKKFSMFLAVRIFCCYFQSLRYAVFCCGDCYVQRLKLTSRSNMIKLPYYCTLAWNFTLKWFAIQFLEMHDPYSTCPLFPATNLRNEFCHAFCLSELYQPKGQIQHFIKLLRPVAQVWPCLIQRVDIRAFVLRCIIAKWSFLTL